MKTHSSSSGPKILTGNQFLLEGFSDNETLQLRSVILGQGATVSKFFNKKISCIIIKVVGGPLYRICEENNIAAVRPQWLIDSISQKRYIPFTEYTVPPFFGLIISCTGFESSDREEMKVAVENLGGVFMKDLVRGTTTHLICFTPSGAKYESAKQWGDVKIINAHWIIDCVENNRWMPEEKYPMIEEQLLTNSEIDGIKPQIEGNHAETIIEPSEPTTTTSAKRPISTQLDVDPSSTNTSAKRQKTVNISLPSNQETEEDLCIKEALALTNAEQYLVESLSVESLPQFDDSGGVYWRNDSLMSVSKPQIDFSGAVFFFSGYPPMTRRYFQRLILCAKGQVSLVLNQDVHFAALYMPAPQSGNSQITSTSSQQQYAGMSSVQRAQANQQQMAYHQRAVRLAKQSGLQRVNLIWCLDLLVGREHWQHILPSTLAVALPLSVNHSSTADVTAYTEDDDALDLDS